MTIDGLEDQMLSRLVALENPNLEVRKTDILTKNAEEKRKLQQIEDTILCALSVQGATISDLLRDETLINELQNSKRLFTEISKRIEDSLDTEKIIDDSRELYRPTARTCSLTYFTLRSMFSVNHMYQWSIGWLSMFVDSSCGVVEQTESDRVMERG